MGRWGDGAMKNARRERTLAALRWWADLLDSRFRIPGLDVRFGLDPLFSLIPGLGDLASPIFAVVLIVQGLRQGVPKVVLVRMVLNAFIDAMIGVIPVLGNVGDIFWRANLMNLALLERHARPGARPSAGDYAFVWTIGAVFAALITLPVVLALWLGATLYHWLAR